MTKKPLDAMGQLIADDLRDVLTARAEAFGGEVDPRAEETEQVIQDLLAWDTLVAQYTLGGDADDKTTRIDVRYLMHSRGPLTVFKIGAGK